MRSLQIFGVFFIACLPMGCASWPVAKPLNNGSQNSGSQNSSSTSDQALTEDRALQLIATDFVLALQQLPSMLPSSTTVQMLSTDAEDRFTLHMKEALQSAGYGTRWVADSSWRQLFQFRHERALDSASMPVDLYEIAIGAVELRRRYARDVQSRISPASPLYVRGADARGIRLDDAHFESAGEASPSLAGRVAADRARREHNQDGSNAIAFAGSSAAQPLSIAPEASPLNPLIAGVDRRKRLSLPLVALPRIENVFELGGSNYQQLLASHQVVREQVLTFANDSLRLGAVNKHLVAQMVESFQPGSDVFSVIGCSLGPTQLKSGNAALALGRASRVREALLFAGVPQDRILDEGCWAGDSSGNELPRRGVVLTLNRRT